LISIGTDFENFAKVAKQVSPNENLNDFDILYEQHTSLLFSFIHDFDEDISDLSFERGDYVQFENC
jgi:hypothetical protein